MIRVHGNGNVVSDPEVRHTPGGKAVCTVRVAAYNGKDAKLFIDLEVWEDVAENVRASSLSKGDRVVFDGLLREDEWLNKEGETRRKMKISVSEIGPSLTYAYAKVTKVESNQDAGDRRQRSERSAEVTDEARAVQATVFADDEEPF